MKKVFILLAFASLTFVSCEVLNNLVDEVKDAVTEIKVAQDALVAYFPLDNTDVKVGDLTLDSQGAGTEANFVEGRRGKCYQGSVDSYLRYNIPDGSPIKTLKAFSLSMWLKHAEVDYDHVPVPMVFQITRTDDRCWGNLAVAADRTAKGAGWLAWKIQAQMGTSGNMWKTTDGAVKNEETGVDEYPWANVFPAGRWSHVIWTYDNVESKFHVYVNGVDVTPEAYVDCWKGEDVPVGDLEFINADQIMIGNWDVKYTSAEGWGWKDAWIGDFSEGQVDEIRLYSRALTAVEAAALYAAEVAVMD